MLAVLIFMNPIIANLSVMIMRINPGRVGRHAMSAYVVGVLEDKYENALRVEIYLISKEMSYETRKQKVS